MMKKTIEQQAADTILQTPERITIAGKEYDVAPPSLGTLMMMSAEVSALQKPAEYTSDMEAIRWVLENAKDYRRIGRVLAVLILGARSAQEPAPTQPWYLRIFKRQKSRLDRLAGEILNGLTAAEASDLIARLLLLNGVSDFFALTTSLKGANALAPTKEVEHETTAPGL